MNSNRKFNKFLSFLFPILLVLVSIYISFKNYTPGTYLIGWDSMHPEFNFSLNAGRLLSHVWGGEMGVGAISAHSDMSDLPRVLVLWLTSALVPISFIRYFYIFTCLILGPLGMYLFLKYVFQREKESAWIYPAAFLGALFYLLNLGTLQNFYVPLEMFTVAFAGAPWLFLFGLKYLRDGKKSSLVFLSLVLILVAPMAYAATQAYALYLGLFLFFLSFSIFSAGKKLKLKRFLILGIVTIVLNIYWILPSVYSVAQQSLTISNANINRLFSQESFLRNADYGDIKDILIQKSFLFTWRSFDFSSNTFKDLLGAWSTHLSVPLVNLLGYLLAFLAVGGIILGTIKREKVSLGFILPLILSLFFLFNINPPFGEIYRYLYTHFSIFSEGFRTPFTKFSVLFEFILSFYFAYFCYVIFTAKIKYTAFFKLLGLAWLTGAIIAFTLPAFYGELIGPNVRVKFPSEYRQLFSWFKGHPEGRAALLPMGSKFGWEYRSWGYEGSGFLTYGIPNPIFYRDFDRWNSANEDFFNQASFALYAGDDEGFARTLKKYKVKYLLLDESVINAGGTSDILNIPQIKNIIQRYSMPEVAKFGYLKVFDTGFEDNLVTAPDSFSEVKANLSYSPLDPIYQEVGDYIEGGESRHPFMSLDRRSGVDIGLVNGNLEFKNGSFNADLSIPATSSAKADLFVNQGFPEAYNCDLKKVGEVSKVITQSGVLYGAKRGAASCDYISFPDLEYSQGYALRLTGENKSGRSLKIYLFDSVSQVPGVEEILPTGKFDEIYFIYPRKLKGKGYILNFETRSFGRIPSENLLTGVEFYSADYNQLVNFGKQSQGFSDSIQNNLRISNVKKLGDLIYKVDVGGTGLLELNQGYEKGWVAIQLPINNFQFTTLPHTKVNSWANGWTIPAYGLRTTDYGLAEVSRPSTVVLFYWPQLLEWGGIVFGVVFLLVLLMVRKTGSS